MTIITTQSRITYAGDNVTTLFPIPFEFFLNSDITAVKTTVGGAQSTLVLNTDYTLSGANVPGGGSATKTTPLLGGETLALFLNPPITQASHYISNAPFPAATLENDIDRQAQISQRLQDQISRSMRAPDGDVNPLFVLPNAKLRANTAQGWDSLGNPTLLPLAGQAFPVLQIVSPMQYGAVGNGIADDTVAIQNAISSNPRAWIIFPGLSFKISSQINFLKACKVTGVRGLTTIILATQNQNGFVVGNDTLATRTATNDTSIDGIAFNPSATVAAFTSGYCVYLNYTEFTQVTNCFFYGTNGASNILWQGVQLFQATEPVVSNNYFYNLLSYGLYANGGAGALRTVDGRFDYNEFVACGNDCVHLDLNCAGCTINFMIAYGFSTWGIVLNTGSSGNGSLHYIAQPDIEADGSSGGIYIQNSANVDISGGWVGTNTFSGTTPSLWTGAASNSVKVTGTQFLFGRVQVDGPASTFTGCDIVGDNVAVTMAYQISSTATDTSISGGTVRQHKAGGIQFTSTPPAARCKINGVNFKNCGPVAGTGYEIVGSTGAIGSILGVSGSPANLPPTITGCQSDFPFTLTSAASVTVSPTRDFYQCAGAAPNITTLTNCSTGTRITIQSSGGITLASGGNLVLKTSPTTIGSGNTMSFKNDGQNWFEDGRSF